MRSGERERLPVTYEIVEDGELIEAKIEDSLLSTSASYPATTSCMQPVVDPLRTANWEPLVAGGAISDTGQIVWTGPIEDEDVELLL